MHTVKFNKRSAPALYCMLAAAFFLPLRAEAGWLLWEAPDNIAAPAGEKEVRSAQDVLDALPLKAFLERRPGTDLELDAIFEAGTDDLRFFFAKAGFEETPYEFKKAFFGGLTQLFSAKAPSKFLPAQKWLAPPVCTTAIYARHKFEDIGSRPAAKLAVLAAPVSGLPGGDINKRGAGGRPQDLAFLRSPERGRQGAYLWRLPCRTKKAPLWVAGMASPDGERGWDLSFGKAQKNRALKTSARHAGKTYLIFTLP